LFGLYSFLVQVWSCLQVIISEQGVGKGMIFSSLIGGMFQELGLHVTNFDSVVNRYIKWMNCLASCVI
jgi:hypothetical protein